jgi:hypothetical protein
MHLSRWEKSSGFSAGRGAQSSVRGCEAPGEFEHDPLTGCAGSEAVTLIDESGRSRKQSKDTLGRLLKVEEINWDGSVYATTEYAYNALDQMILSRTGIIFGIAGV